MRTKGSTNLSFTTIFFTKIDSQSSNRKWTQDEGLFENSCLIIRFKKTNYLNWNFYADVTVGDFIDAYSNRSLTFVPPQGLLSWPSDEDVGLVPNMWTILSNGLFCTHLLIFKCVDEKQVWINIWDAISTGIPSFLSPSGLWLLNLGKTGIKQNNSSHSNNTFMHKIQAWGRHASTALKSSESFKIWVVRRNLRDCQLGPSSTWTQDVSLTWHE